MSITAMKIALNALELATTPLAKDRQEVLQAITALRTAIAEAEKQEPFCYLYYERGEEMFAPPEGYRPDDAQALYLAPQPAPPQAQTYSGSSTAHVDPFVQAQEPRKPLTSAELEALYDKFAKHQEYGAWVSGWHEFARAIEAAHGIKEQP